MRTKPPTTTEIVALHVLGRRTDQFAVDWAVDLLVRGYDTPALRQLAGESEPFLYNEIATLLRRVFRQLDFELPDDRRVAIWLLISAQIRLVSEGEIPSDEVLLEISNCYDELGRPESLHDLYMLAIAMWELEYDEYSPFWPEATRENIDQIVIDQCRAWLAEHGTSVELPEPGEQ